jgi:hypothetical protein
VSRPPLEVRIDSLAVHGFDPDDPEGIAAAVEGAVAGALGDEGWTEGTPEERSVGTAVALAIQGRAG